MSTSIPIVFLMGPTASGKTDAALSIAQDFPIEIISVDSALVYRGMDIGTAKPSLEIRSHVPHHLIDIRDPADSYSVAEFCKDTKKLIPEILARGNYPLLVGGTMMYFKSLVGGLSKMPSASPDIRAELDKQAKQKGWEAMHQQLAEVDPETAARLHPNDTQRIQRALEIFLSTGKTSTELRKENKTVFPFEYQSLAVSPAERSVLHQRIAQRFDYMLHHGLIEEVKGLMDRGDLHMNMPSMRAVGYRQVWEGLVENRSVDEIRERGIAATRQLAKRQLTWLRHWPDLQLFDSTSPDVIIKLKQTIAQYWAP